jgi:hypothetical protein
METRSKQSGGQSVEEAERNRHFERKEEWKNRPGNRYTAEEISAPSQGSEWKLAEREEKYIWPCP